MTELIQTIHPQIPLVPLSPPEIYLVILTEELDSRICPGGAVVGPATHAQQQAGVVSITDAGNDKIDQYVPVMWKRLQLRVLSRTLEQTDRIAAHVYAISHVRHRQVVEQPSSGNTYLIHSCNVSAGPSTHFDSEVTWEALMFVTLMIGRDPVS